MKSVLEAQISRVEIYRKFMHENIRRVSLITGRMKVNKTKCRLASVKAWKDKAEKLLDAKNKADR